MARPRVRGSVSLFPIQSTSDLGRIGSFTLTIYRRWEVELKPRWHTTIRGLESKIRVLRSERRRLLIASDAGADAEKVNETKERIDTIQEMLQKLEEQLTDAQFVMKVDELLRPRPAPKCEPSA